MQRKWDTDDKQLNQKCLDEVIARIQEISDVAQVGVIAAQDVIDIVLENLAPQVYNKGINDAQKLLRDKYDILENDIELLKQ